MDYRWALMFVITILAYGVPIAGVVFLILWGRKLTRLLTEIRDRLPKE